jgi:transposase
VAKDLDLTESALRIWVRRAEQPLGKSPGGALGPVEREELLRLRCEYLEVSHSGFYAWRKRPKSARQQVDKQLAEEVKLRESQHTCQPDYWRDLAF